MANYAVVDGSGNVVNVIVWDGITPFIPPSGCVLIQSNVAGYGGTLIDSVYTPPTALTPSTPTPDLATQLAAALINNGTLQASDINSATLTQVNATLTAAGQTAIAITNTVTTTNITN